MTGDDRTYASARRYARELGLPLNTGHIVSWDTLLDACVAEYWRKRPRSTKPVEAVR